jgi:hypothetical protein
MLNKIGVVNIFSTLKTLFKKPRMIEKKDDTQEIAHILMLNQ